MFYLPGSIVILLRYYLTEFYIAAFNNLFIMKLLLRLMWNIQLHYYSIKSRLQQIYSFTMLIVYSAKHCNTINSKPADLKSWKQTKFTWGTITPKYHSLAREPCVLTSVFDCRYCQLLNHLTNFTHFSSRVQVVFLLHRCLICSNWEPVLDILPSLLRRAQQSDNGILT